MKYTFKMVQSEEYGFVIQVIHQNRQVVAECRNKDMANRVARGLELEYSQRKNKSFVESIDDRLAKIEMLAERSIEMASKAFYSK